MALFAGQPAGIQIKKWLIILVTLIVVINVMAAASLVIVQKSMSDIQGRYQPVMISASEISTQVHQAQASLYKYLGEYLPDTAEVKDNTAVLEKTLQKAREMKAAGEWLDELEAIRGNLAKYRVVVSNLPAIGARTDWGEVDEFRSQAVELGRSMEEQASSLKAKVGARIRTKAERSLRVSSIAVVVFLCFLALSALITVLLLVWWRQFQDMILNL
jgi:flagellar basal body-associated protein FliL